MIKKPSFIYKSVLICIIFLFFCTGCGDQYRYFCQNPDNFKAPQCQKPRCEFDQDCPEYLIAPILEKKVEGNTTSAPVQQVGTTNCR